MRTIILTVIFIAQFVPVISAETKDLDEMGIKGMELVLDLQFDEANKIFDEMIRMEPENAMGYYLKSKSFFWMYLFGNNEEEYFTKFEDLSLETIDISKKMLSRNKDDIDALFYSGTAYLFLGRRYGEKGSMFKAFWYARKGTKYLEKAIKKDSDYYDAYLGTGIYKYYVDVLPKFIKSLSFLLGLGGDREEGIEQVTLASLKGHLARDEAKFILAQAIYVEIENDYETALELFEELIVKYPNNLNFKMSLAACHRNLFQYDLAVQTIKDLLQTESLKKFPNTETLLYRHLGNTCSDMNEHCKAIQAFEKALTLLEAQKRTKSWEYEGALYFIGDCYEMMGEVDKAHEYYSRVSKEDKTGAYAAVQARFKHPLTLARINLTKGTNYSRYGKYSKAEAIFNELITSELSKNPVNNTFLAETYFNLGVLKYNLNEYQSSIKTFQKVLDMNEVQSDWIFPWTHCYLGHCYKDTGEMEKAKQEYDIAYEFEGNMLRLAVDKARKEMEGK